jgi:hypothetical protein
MKNNNQNMFPQKLNRTGGVMDRVVVLGAVMIMTEVEIFHCSARWVAFG